jgi:hypothetical protein
MIGNQIGKLVQRPQNPNLRNPMRQGMGLDPRTVSTLLYNRLQFSTETLIAGPRQCLLHLPNPGGKITSVARPPWYIWPESRWTLQIVLF